MRQPILVLNAGSSSVKFAIYDMLGHGSPVAGAHGEVERIGSAAHLTVRDAAGNGLAERELDPQHNDHRGAVAAIHDWLYAHVGDESALHGIGHRVVHGGMEYDQPVRIDDGVLRVLDSLIPLAPLHQPHAIAAIRAVTALAPNVPQIACFDTAFHRSQRQVAQAFALPRALTAKGIRRYGFHGLSYEYIVSALPSMAPKIAGGRIVVAHLGNGASMCAIAKGRSVASTMGFTAVDGLPMGTRSGSLDPGVVLYLMQHEGMSAHAIETLLYQQSGLLGVSGLSGDMRILLASDAVAAREAVDLFVYRIGRELGSLAAALGGIDALVFTAGIGEHAAEIRARVCRDAAWLGVAIDDAANDAGGPRISQANSPVSAWVVPSDENLMIARHTSDLLKRGV